MAQLPDPKSKQIAEALAKANDFRLKRSALKHDLGALRVDALAKLLDPPEWLLQMPTIDFVMALPRVGRHRALVFINSISAGELREIGKLTPRQRAVLYETLAGALSFR